MLLQQEQCYQALLSHDARFDGRFFVGVTSTGIYCRPVCTAKTPRLENCRFFVGAAAAETAGFRPCLRCRPELAPGNAMVDAGPRLAEIAAMRMDEGDLTDDSLESVATELQVTSRHLRRVFREHFGVAPVAYRQTQRLLLAKRLLTDTRMPVTEIALLAGFQSVRRFNSLFLERYRMPPSRFRRFAADEPPANADWVQFDLGYRPPLAWEHLLGFLEYRAVPGVELVRSGAYLRVLSLQRHGTRLAGVVRVSPSPRANCLRVEMQPALLPACAAVLERVKRVFDLAADPARISSVLGDLARAVPGARVPGSWDAFELLVRAILGQQVSVKAARTLAGRVVQAYGVPVQTPFPELTHAFPSARDLALAAEELTQLGITGSRARTISAAAQAIASGALKLRSGEPVHTTMAALRALPGIGEWTAQYVAMRALSWPDAFPHGDLVLCRAMGGLTPAKALAAAEQWRPWRAYAAIHLWAAASTSLKA